MLQLISSSCAARCAALKYLVCCWQVARKLLVSCLPVPRPLKLPLNPVLQDFRASTIARAPGRRPANRQCSKVPNSDLCLEPKPVATTEWELTTPSLERVHFVVAARPVSRHRLEFYFEGLSILRAGGRNRRGSKVLANWMRAALQAVGGRAKACELFGSASSCFRLLGGAGLKGCLNRMNSRVVLGTSCRASELLGRVSRRTPEFPAARNRSVSSGSYSEGGLVGFGRPAGKLFGRAVW